MCAALAVLVFPGEKCRADTGVGGLLSAGLEETMDSMFGGCLLPGPVSRDLDALYQRHRDEVVSITEDDPTLLVEIVRIGVELMPGIEEAKRNGGRLPMSRGTYNRGQALLDRYATAGSPGLASDVGTIKRLIETHTREVAPEHLVLDLSR